MHNKRLRRPKRLATLLSAATIVLASSLAHAGAPEGVAAPAPVEDLSQPAQQPGATLPPVIHVNLKPATVSGAGTVAVTPASAASQGRPDAAVGTGTPPSASSRTGAQGSVATDLDPGVQADIDAALPPLGSVASLVSPAVRAVNDARPGRTVIAGKFSAAVLRAQILLDRAHFSPGEIDGAYGNNMAVALAGYQHDHRLPVTGSLDAATWAALTHNDPAPVLSGYQLAIQDVSGPFVKAMPGKILNQAKLPCACYASPWEELGEKLHIRPALLAHLNRGRELKPGAVLIVPLVHHAPPAGRAARIIVSAHLKAVVALDAGSHILAQYPATIGSTHDPLPIGRWKILGVAHHPRYHYDPVHFWDANHKDPKATVPAGPNNPVGIVWTQLSIPHYGIHGTPAPGMIGKSYSHGCIRLTNWDALEFSKLVRPGTPAILEP